MGIWLDDSFPESLIDRDSFMYNWMGKIIVDAQAGLARYKVIQPPTETSSYFTIYYETLFELSKLDRQTIIDAMKDEKAKSEFWDNYKWWIVGGGIAAITVFAAMKSM